MGFDEVEAADAIVLVDDRNGPVGGVAKFPIDHVQGIERSGVEIDARTFTERVLCSGHEFTVDEKIVHGLINVSECAQTGQFRTDHLQIATHVLRVTEGDARAEQCEMAELPEDAIPIGELKPSL